MLLTIHDMTLRQVASVDNNKQGTLNYFNDTWTRYLETGSSTFDFTVSKKALKTDTGKKKAYSYLNEKAFVSFEYEGETHLFTVRKTVENEKLIKVHCVNLNLELINEYANPFKASKSMTFREYCEAMDLLNFTMLSIGLNELSDRKITAEWEGADTKLARLLSLAKKFEAELEFKTFLNDDSTIKKFLVNVYHQKDDLHQGIGRLQPKPLRYGKDFKSLSRTVDKTEIYNMIRPTGRDDKGNTVTISSLGAWSVNNAKGEREFYQAGDGLYAPLSMQMYPAAFVSGTMTDQWIRKDMTVESSSPEIIRATAFRELKKYAYPAVSYEIEGFTELGIGDTVHVYDDGFSPTLLLEMRVSEQSISFTNKSNNKTTFSNAKALENRLSGGIQQRLDRMIEDAKPYIVKLATDSGVVFKNGRGQSIVTPTLYRGGKVVSNNVTWRWSLDGNVTTGQTYLVRGVDVTGTATLTVAAYIGNTEVAVDEITLVNVTDGQNGAVGPQGPAGERGAVGPQGPQGVQGPKGDRGSDGLPGRDGVGIRSTAVTYAGSTNGTTAPTTGWTVAVPTVAPGNYLWTKTVWTYTDGNKETGYTVSRIGRDGNTGRDGIAGKDGVGIRSTTISYGQSASGTTQPTTWTAQVPSVPSGQYLWTRTVWTYTDNTSETGYSVAKMGDTGAKGDRGATGPQGLQGPAGPQGPRGIQGLQGPKGDQGIAGPKGADGRTQYTHIAYADNATGGGFSQSDKSKAYIGMYQDFTATDSTNPASYRWTKWKGDKGDTGAQGIPGPKGADGRTPYIHFAYSDNADGTGLTTSDNGQRYIGHYSDYTQADSTDKTKYRWADRWAKIEVGGTNQISLTEASIGYRIGTKGENIEDILHTVTKFTPVKYSNYVLSYDGELDNNLSHYYSLAWYSVPDTSGFISRPTGPARQADLIKGIKLIPPSNATYLRVSFPIACDKVMLNAGTIKLNWSQSPEDIQSQISTKADQALTQEQLNALNEKASLMQAELEAKASAATLDNWIKAYQDFVKANDTARAQAEKDLIAASQRVSAIAKNLGDLSDRWNFIDTYMSSSNEGLVIGKNDGSSSMMFNPNGRISMFSAGVEVMYISQGVIHIENGIFSKTIQVGRFREEQYHLNPDANVIRYVG